ncbi:HesA/MoeB/ThiF family protein [Shewanella sp. C32]|uniref:HesA/MoeB/ThiF family protein n=1 Tax=Shewanella electrica TaxID=515560 RepID=A0ABT2FLB4_9GAMM|nr:HesA/MoeB/ThiF family protein [Shewanella electrica]MCH1923844.1 HesA/MoeB/ThiF family protein [Shewanella electrica]MCS4557063.1 HesA/MoeB/ThiF family protein [Shewanella electrica]
MTKPITALTSRQFMRYSRQIMLPHCGEAGQLTLLNAHAVIVGVGGLGQHVAQLLAAAGVGRLTLIDHDTVALDNLPRQTLYRDSHVGQAKVLVAARKLRQRYSDCNVDTVIEPFGAPTQQQLPRADVVLDCSDNFACRHALSEASYQQQLPLVSAAIAAEQAWLAMFTANDIAQFGCLHCVFPADTQTSQSCASNGVMGSAVATVASLQADVALRYLLGATSQLAGQMLHIDFGALQFTKLQRSRDPLCENCASPLRKCS